MPEAPLLMATIAIGAFIHQAYLGLAERYDAWARLPVGPLAAAFVVGLGGVYSGLGHLVLRYAPAQIASSHLHEKAGTLVVVEQVRDLRWRRAPERRRLVVIDVRTGKELTRRMVGTGAELLGPAGDRLWFFRERGGLELRDPRTGVAVVRFRALAEKNPLLAKGIVERRYDARTGGAYVVTVEGHALLIDPSTLVARKASPDEVVAPKAAQVTSRVLPLPGGGGELRLEGEPRLHIVPGQRAGPPVGATFLDARFVNVPEAALGGTVLVLDRDRVDRLARLRLSRVSVDGTVHWTTSAPFEGGRPGALYRVHPAPGAPSELIVIASSPSRATRLDLATGRIVWQRRL